MLISFALISVRVFAKEILVDRLHVRNEAVSFAADYYWGDQLADDLERSDTPGESDEYKKLRSIYTAAVSTQENGSSEISSIFEDTISETEPEGMGDQAEMSVAEKLSARINEAEKDIGHYCNFHFILRPFLTDLRLSCYKVVSWNMAFARNTGEDFMMKNGVVYPALQLQDSITVDTTVMTLAEKYDVQYLYVQYPSRIRKDDDYVPYGVSNFYAENEDNKIRMIREMNKDVMDLRNEMYRSGWDHHEGFYLTDGHWKTDAGFVAAGLLAGYLEQNYNGFICNDTFHDPASYSITSAYLNNPMIRETVDLYLPEFPTDFHVIRIMEDEEKDVEVQGDFSSTLYDLRKAEEGRFANVLTVYSASNVGSELTEITNRMDTDHYGTILFVSNSFSWHVIPYLAMDCDRIYYVPPGAGVEEYIRQLQPDIIIETSSVEL